MAPDLREQAWDLLNRARLSFEGHDIGVLASTDDAHPELNYGHCFVRDFALCAPAFLLRGETDIVRRFLAAILHLQAQEEVFEAFRPHKGLMPASFRPEKLHGWPMLEGDYGEESIARVTPVDSVFWWLLTLRAYTRATGDRELARMEEFQRSIRLILELTLQGTFEIFPTLLVPEGSFMIDRRLGVYGHPLEVQALFFASLRAATELLDDGGEWLDRSQERLRNLEHHIVRYYWLNHAGLEELRTQPRDRYGEDAANVFNVFHESIPEWVDAWIPEDGGYFVGNVGPGRMDFRFFAQGNLLAISTGLSDPEHNRRLMRVYEEHWDELVGATPLRIVYPALEGEAWRAITGADEKNRPWAYHNGGSWPCLLWSFATATIACGRQDLLERAVAAAEERLEADAWPEYYDGLHDPRPGAGSRRFQSWSAGAYLYAKACLEDASVADLYRWEPNVQPERAERRHTRTGAPEAGAGESRAGSRQGGVEPE